jgi:glycyl-tRNA synthetase
MVGLDCAIIMHPQVWKVSGHYDLFHDFKVECRESKKRYRFDQVKGRWVQFQERFLFITVYSESAEIEKEIEQRALKFFNLRGKTASELKWHSRVLSLNSVPPVMNLIGSKDGTRVLTLLHYVVAPDADIQGSFNEPREIELGPNAEVLGVFGPDAKTQNTLGEPREFNLMMKTIIGALGGEDDAAFLRPETAQGIFCNYKNVVDSSRVKIPFGIGQVGKSFRNEITPRNFTFRSREFEQMEIEFFCKPNTSPDWYKFWRDRRYQWYLNLGLAKDRLRLRDHHKEELSHYSCGTADIEYAFPFLAEGDFGELEGIAHRGDFDLRSHQEGKLARQGDQLVVELGPDGKPKYRGSGKDLSYFEEATKERFVPHVIEPSAGADRATLAFLCEAYHEEQVKGETRVVMRLHPRIAPFKAAVFPLVNKVGMPEIAQTIYRDLKKSFNVFYDDSGAVGRRYRRQDEAGTPYCITVDGQTLQDQTVTIRDRDTLQQERVAIAELESVLRARIAR